MPSSDEVSDVQPGARVDTYTHGHHASVVQQHALRTAENSAAFLLPLLCKGHHLLDVGCGPGSITIGLADRVTRVTAVDSSPSVLEDARKAAAGRDDIVFMEASVYKLPFEAETFDVVFAHQVLQHLSDPVAALREMLRVVKPGGVVAARDAIYSTMCGAPAIPELHRWQEVYMATCRRNGAEPDGGRFLKQWMIEAGFPAAQIRYSNSVVTYSSEDEAFRKAWGEAWAKRVVASDFAKQALEYGIVEGSCELETIAAGWDRWAADENAVFCYVNGQVLCSVMK